MSGTSHRDIFEAYNAAGRLAFWTDARRNMGIWDLSNNASQNVHAGGGLGNNKVIAPSSINGHPAHARGTSGGSLVIDFLIRPLTQPCSFVGIGQWDTAGLTI